MSEKPTFTPRDIELITIAFQCSKDPHGFQIDSKRFMELAKLKTPASANACWGVVRKKLLSSTDAATSNGDAAPKPSSAIGDPTKPKATPKKRVSAKAKAKAGAEAEAEADAEGENGVAADDEQTPTNTPKKKGGAKRKAPEPSSPMKTEDNPNAATEDAAAHGEDATTDGTPAKKKRVYNRKPKDPNAPAPNPRAKKGAKAAATTAAATADDNTDEGNAQLLDEAEGEHSSIFGDGNIKIEGPDELTEEERYLAQKAIDEETFGFTNDKANGDEIAV